MKTINTNSKNTNFDIILFELMNSLLASPRLADDMLLKLELILSVALVIESDTLDEGPDICSNIGLLKSILYNYIG
jgi:hypothetical protein